MPREIGEAGGINGGMIPPDCHNYHETAFLANLSAEERHLIETSRTMTTHNDYLVALAEVKRGLTRGPFW